MNSVVGDAYDLSWKMAVVIKGWGGPGLLDGYEEERRPIGLRNRDASGWAAAGVPIWRARVTPAIHEATLARPAAPQELAPSLVLNHLPPHLTPRRQPPCSHPPPPLTPP